MADADSAMVMGRMFEIMSDLARYEECSLKVFRRLSGDPTNGTHMRRLGFPGMMIAGHCGMAIAASRARSQGPIATSPITDPLGTTTTPRARIGTVSRSYTLMVRR